MRSASIAFALGAIAAALPAAGAEEPLWEAGIGMAALSFPDYRGSDRSQAYLLPAPYFVYRGEFLKADRHGIRGILFNTDRIDLNLSVGASLPVESDEMPARAGMPDLDPSIELGPSLDITLWRRADRTARLDLRLPVRGAVTVSSDPRYIGVQFFPHLNVDVHDPFGMSGWNLGLLAGPVFTDARYNRHYYSVEPRFVTPDRPAYDARGGFAGTQFLAALSRRFPKFWVGGFARYDTLRGATFEESPLVTSKRYAAAGIGISWIFGQSSRKVQVDALGERPQ
ncbi:MAG TPA: MipA/OmpV family protein [Usitatibacter sp.]|nr:MipA/OmpV family protein [Usitatibacter sp.]